MSSGKKRGSASNGTGPKDAKKLKSSGIEATIGRSIPHPQWFNVDRVRTLTSASELVDGQVVIYWMSRDQRAEDNWALLLARHLAVHKNVPLAVCFNLVPKFLDATIRQFGFMLKGLQEVDAALAEKNVPFYLLRGEAVETVPKLAKDLKACAVVTDFSPLRVPLLWVSGVAKALDGQIPLLQVDAHNVVPVWIASNKPEVGARTIRKKIHDQLYTYLRAYPADDEAFPPNPKGHSLPVVKNDWQGALDSLEVDKSVAEVDWVRPGTAAAKQMMEEFIEKRLKDYGDKRNDPTKVAVSNLSPYFHFGQISAQAAVMRLKQVKRYHEAVQSFIEEAVVRRELADNFCFYQPNYDNLEGAAGWARESLEKHRKDPRPFVFSLEDLEKGMTHDKLWNAAQLQMVREGKMHGFLRMYWAKKILEWTETAADAMKYAIYLNDKYEIDGRDPNGYTGIAWSIMGTHDMGWTERTIFGKIRYMNYAGCQRKFNIEAFCKKHPGAEDNAKAFLKLKGKEYGRESVPMKSLGK